MKKNTIYKVNKHLIIVEKYFKDKDQYGYIEVDENGDVIISIQKNIPAWQKVLALQHELTHLSQFATEDTAERNIKGKRAEKKAETMAYYTEGIIAWVAQKIEWYQKGIDEIKHKKHKGEGENV
jgi:Zn-dependent peptidase ImmA (M78 family)